MIPSPRRLPHLALPKTAVLLAGSFVSACAAEPDPPHPWMDLSGAPTHEIVEVSGATAGQLVLVVPEDSSDETVMELARIIADQAPVDATVNARIFNDLDTARGWRTAPAEWTVQHLLAVVTHLPGSDSAEVRWMRPEEPAQPNASPADSTEGVSGLEPGDATVPSPDGGL